MKTIKACFSFARNPAGYAESTTITRPCGRHNLQTSFAQIKNIGPKTFIVILAFLIKWISLLYEC